MYNRHMNTDSTYHRETEQSVDIPIHELETTPSGEKIYFSEYKEEYIPKQSKGSIEAHIQELKNGNEEKPSQLLVPIENEKYLGSKILFDKKGTPQFLLFSEEIDKQLKDQIKQKELEEKCLIDSLTGLVNRSGWDKQLKILEDRIDRNEAEEYVSVVILDLNNLKIINDREGHNKGDEKLRELSNILKQVFRSKDTISRWGGDEFAVLATSNKDITPIIERRLQDSITPNLNYCAGIYTEKAKNIINGSNNSLSEIVKKADALLMDAKKDAANKTINGIKPTEILTNQIPKYTSE